MMKYIVLLVIFVCLVAIGFILLSGSDFIFLTLPGNMPLGNIMAALGFMLPSVGINYFMSDIERFRVLRKISLIASCIWLPLSMALSGNLQLTFEYYNFRVWLCFSLIVSVLIMFTLIHSIIYCIVNQRARRLNQV